MPKYHDDKHAASNPSSVKGGRAAKLIVSAVVALVLAFILSFISILLIGFSFDAPGSHFTDSGLWFRLLILWPPVSLLLVALASIACIFLKSLRLLWIALVRVDISPLDLRTPVGTRKPSQLQTLSLCDRSPESRHRFDAGGRTGHLRTPHSEAISLG